eukprot:6214030-Pleurochrysis_carterae.AAC.1
MQLLVHRANYRRHLRRHALKSEEVGERVLEIGLEMRSACGRHARQHDIAQMLRAVPRVDSHSCILLGRVHPLPRLVGNLRSRCCLDDSCEAALRRARGIASVAHNERPAQPLERQRARLRACPRSSAISSARVELILPAR